jgi:hypothetical protein
MRKARVIRREICHVKQFILGHTKNLIDDFRRHNAILTKISHLRKRVLRPTLRQVLLAAKGAD